MRIPGKDLSTIDAEFRHRIEKAYQAAPPSARAGFNIISARRSTALQAQLYQRYKSGRGGIAAPPGHSMHERGLAVDVRDPSGWFHKHAGEYGLNFPLGRKDWPHMQMAGSGGGRTGGVTREASAASTGTGRVATSGTGGVTRTAGGAAGTRGAGGAAGVSGAADGAADGAATTAGGATDGASYGAVSQVNIPQPTASMEQYRLETIEMTDLGQSAEWAQEMQKALAEEKQHDQGASGGAAPAYGGHRRGGVPVSEGAGAGESGAPEAGAADQGAPGNINAGAVTAVGGGPPKAFIMHHTGGRGTAAGVQAVLKQRHLGVQYVMDREGNITRIGGPGEHHILPGTGVGAGLRNSNVVGMEVIAKNDADVTLAQVAAAKRFMQKYYPNTPVFGHGEVNPGHKEATEGATITRAIRAERAAGRGRATDAPAIRERAVGGGRAAADPGPPPAAPEPVLDRRARDDLQHNVASQFHNDRVGQVSPRFHHDRTGQVAPHHRAHRNLTPPPPRPHLRRFIGTPQHNRQLEPSYTPTPPSRSFAGVQGLPGSPSGPAPERTRNP